MALQIVLISGCSSGIGLATAVLLAKDPEKRFKVYATMRNLAKKGQLEEEGKEHLGDTLIIKQMDVCSDESVSKAVQKILDTEGKIDVLFNNAGIGIISPLECFPISKAQEMMDVNFFGTLRLTKVVLPGMKARKSGHIIQCSSEHGVIGFPFSDIYTATKFAMEGFTECLAPMLRQFNVRCTLLEPGPVKTLFIENGVTWGKSIDMSTADEKTQELFKQQIEIVGELVTKALDESVIARAVKEIILGQITQFRYQTNADYMAREIASKLKDPAGNETVELIANRFYGQH